MRRVALSISVAVLCFTALIVLGYQYLPSVEGSQDPGVYNRIATDVQRMRTGEISTLESEYPPFASSIFFFVATNPLHLSFAQAWLLLLLLLAVVTSIAVATGRGSWPAYVFPLTLLLTVFLLSRETVFARYDIIVALLLTLSWNTQRRGKFAWAAFFLVLAGAIKLLPILLVPLFLACTPRKEWKWWILGAVAGGVFSTLMPVLVLGSGGFASNLHFFIQYHTDRGFQAESTWSTAHMLYKMLEGQRANLQFHHLALHNVDLPGVLGMLAGLLALGGTLAIAGMAWIRRQGEPIDRFLLASLLWILCASTILSPQYFVWVIPLMITWLLLGTVRREALHTLWWPLVLIVIIGSITHWIYPLHYGEFIDNNNPSLLFLANIRTFALLLLIWSLLPRSLLHLRKKHASIHHASLRTLYISAPIALGIFVLVTYLFVRALCGLLGPVVYQYQGHEAHQTTIPFFVETESHYMDVQVPLTLQPLFPTIFRIKPDDCIERFEIDGKQVDPAIGNFCDYSDGQPVQLGAYLHPGVNHLHLLLGDGGGLGGINITPSPNDPLLVTLGACVLLSACWLFLLIFQLLSIHRRPLPSAIPILFCVGTVLRILYMFITPYNSRGHDTDAHLDYIRYVMTNFRIPLAVDGWEYHQPPLYYFLMAIPGKIDSFFGATITTITAHIQVFSLAFSIGSFAIILWIGTLLFPAAASRSRLVLFGALLTAIPSLLFLSSMVSNDTLYQCLAFGIFGMLLAWWHSGSARMWYALMILVSIAFLTKVSASTFLPIAFFCLLLHRGIPWRKKLLHGLCGVLIVVLLAGWLPVKRIYFEAQNSRTLTLGNEGMSSQLEVPTTPETMLTFSPVGILQTPFINSWYDTSRRQYFWEYFFRSAFFGEYTFDDRMKPISISILFLGLLSLPLILLGLVVSLWKKFRATLPLWFSSFLLLASILSYRLRFAYAPNQDFRFVTVLLVPLAFFAVTGAFALPGKLGQVARGILWALSWSCAAFVLLLALG